MQPLSTRTAHFTDSVIRRMTRISNQYGAVNLSQGFPDFDPPQAILNRLAEVAHEDFHQYSITWGAQNFREALAEKQSRLMGREIDPNSEIVTTCGSTEAMMAAMMTVANPGDKVIVFSPFYENYGADTILSGAEPIYVPLHPPLFTFNVDELEAAFRQHPKALILCNPSNPCGKVFTKEELLFIGGLCRKYDAYMITDDMLYNPGHLRNCLLPEQPLDGKLPDSFSVPGTHNFPMSFFEAKYVVTVDPYPLSYASDTELGHKLNAKFAELRDGTHTLAATFDMGNGYTFTIWERVAAPTRAEVETYLHVFDAENAQYPEMFSQVAESWLAAHGL